MFTKPGVGKTRGMSKPAYCRDSEGGGGGTARRAGFVGAALAVQRQFHEGRKHFDRDNAVTPVKDAGSFD